MILVRTVFHAQFGQAGDLTRFFTEDRARLPEGMRMPTRVLTDLSGPLDTVVVEHVVASVDDYWRRMREMFAHFAAMTQANPLAALVASSHREYYTIEGEF